MTHRDAGSSHHPAPTGAASPAVAGNCPGTAAKAQVAQLGQGLLHKRDWTLVGKMPARWPTQGGCRVEKKFLYTGQHKWAQATHQVDCILLLSVGVCIAVEAADARQHVPEVAACADGVSSSSTQSVGHAACMRGCSAAVLSKAHPPLSKAKPHSQAPPTLLPPSGNEISVAFHSTPHPSPSTLIHTKPLQL